MTIANQVLHTTLDHHFYQQVYLASSKLRKLTLQHTRLLPDYDQVLEAVFYLLYKYELMVSPPASPSLSGEILYSLYGDQGLEKLRHRTRTSTFESYLGLLLLQEVILSKIRGRKILEDFTTLYKEEDLFKEKLDQLMDLAILLQSTFQLEEFSLFSFLEALLEALQGKEQNLPSGLLDKSEEVLASLENDADLTDYFQGLLDDTLDKQKEKPREQAKENIESQLEDFLSLLEKRQLKRGQVEDGLEHYQIPLAEAGNGEDQQVIVNGKPGQNMAPMAAQVTGRQYDTHEGGKEKHAHFPLHGSLVQQEYYLQEKKKDLLKKIDFSRELEEVAGQLDQVKEDVKTIGITEEMTNTLTFDQVISLYQRVKSKSFKQFIDQVGKKKEIARKGQQEKRKYKEVLIDKITYDNDLSTILTDELLFLSMDIEAFENNFYEKYVDKFLQTYQLAGKRKKHKGAIILCYDGSGSMEGKKLAEAQAHILTILELAKVQQRQVVLIQFASAKEPLFIKEVNPKKYSVEDLFEILDTFLCGGTDFKKPLEKALSYIEKDSYSQGDIVFITDGYAELDEAFMKHFLEQKRKKEVKLFSIIIHAHTYDDYGDLGKISDYVLDIKEQDLSKKNQPVSETLYKSI